MFQEMLQEVVLTERHLDDALDSRGDEPESEVEGEGGGTLKAARNRQIDEALARHGGHVPSAAKYLGIGKATLYRILRARISNATGK